jgi:hypothetical protein
MGSELFSKKIDLILSLLKKNLGFLLRLAGDEAGFERREREKLASAGPARPGRFCAGFRK